MAPWPESVADEDYCYVTTAGRRTGRAHTVEIWFAARGSTIYILSGRRADWVRNALANPEVRVRIAGETRPGRARAVEDPGEEARARRLLAGKYQGWKDGGTLSDWASSAFPVAIDFAPG